MQNEKTEERPVLDVAETAQILGVHQTTLRAAINAGTIPCIRLGRRILIPRAALDKLLSNGMELAR